MPLLRAAARAALQGNPAESEAKLRAAGEIGATSVRDVIQAGIPPPLAPATVRRRRIRTPGSRYRRKAQTPAQVTPLVDTGQLIRSIGWELV